MKKTLLISTVSLLALWFAFAGVEIYNPADTSSFLTDAPSDGSDYARNNGAWAVVTSGGGGSITSKTVRIFADAQSQMFGGDTQPSTFIATNAGLSTTHTLAFFEAEKRQHFGASHVFVPLNANSNVILRFPYYSTTTNLTFAPFIWYSDGASSWAVTGTTTTIPACDLTNQAEYAESLTLGNLVAGQWYWISGGIADTNTTGTYTDDINVDAIEFDILAE